MKRIISIVCIIATIFCSVGCGQDTEEIISPVQDFKSLESLNEATGAQLVFPDDFNATNEIYNSVDFGDTDIAECLFIYNDIEFTYRSSATIFSEDISGIYFSSEPAFVGSVPQETEITSDYRYRVARWKNINGQFSLSTTTGITEEEFDSIVTSFVEYSNPVPTGERLVKYYENLIGEYQDKTSERATLSVTSALEGVHFYITWESSENVTSTWEMTVQLSEDGLLHYNDCTQITSEIGDYEDLTMSINEVDGSGYFELGSKGELFWTGASTSECTSCIFKK